MSKGTDTGDHKPSGDLYRSILQTINDGFYRLDFAGRILEVNDAYCRMSGYSETELLGMSMSDLEADESPTDVASHIRRIVETGSDRFQTHHRRRDGSIIALEASVQVIQNFGMICFTRDVTDRNRAEEALKASEQKYRNLFNNAETGMFITRLTDSVVLDVNDWFIRIFGGAKEDFIGTLGLQHWADPGEREELVRRLTQEGKVSNYEIRMRNKDGGIIHCLSSMILYPDQGILEGSIIDITERKRMEEALRESGEKYRALFNNAQVAMFRSRLDGSEMLDVNQKFLEIFGGTRESTIGRPAVTMWVDPRQREEMMRRLKLEGSISNFEYKAINGRGEVAHCLTSVKLYADTGILEGSIIDITERIEAEKRLADSEEKLRVVFEVLPVGVSIGDSNGVVGEMNPALTNLLGMDSTDVTAGRYKARQYLRTDGTPMPEEEFATHRALTENRIVRDVEIGIVKEDGQIIWTAVSAAPMPHGGIVSAVTDITSRKNIEEQIQKLNAELERRVLERTAELAAVNKELEAFSYSVSHDLRSPLRGINGWSDALLQEYQSVLDERGQRYLNIIRAEATRMGQLIDDLLKLSQVTRSDLSRTKFNISALAENIADRLRRAAPERRAEFMIPKDVWVTGDVRLLEIVLTNLFDNAWKFTSTRPTAKIEFGSTLAGGKPAYFVRDNGVGFNPQYAGRLFGAFQRLHSAPEFQGTGIGLTTVQRIIHRHGGTVWAESQPDSGATFYFSLPDSL